MDNLLKIIKNTRDLNLLYVEDNIESREGTLFIFEEFFENIIVAVDGQDGLEKFKNNDINIIITDINMPQLNGLDMLKEIRKIDKYVPILILSAYNESNFFIESIKLDVEGYLLKPIDMEQFLSTLGKIVDKIVLKNEASINLNLLHQYQEVTDMSSIVLKIDINEKITYVNDEFCKISGYTKEELIGEDYNIFGYSGGSKEFYESFWDTVKNKKEVWKGTFKNIAKNKKFFYVKSTVKPIIDTKGEIIEFISLMDDISDVMNPKKQFYDLVESMQESIVIIMKIEDFENLDKYYGQIMISKIEDKFSRVLLSFLPEIYKNENFFLLGNGEYGISLSSDCCDKSVDEQIKGLKEFQLNVNDYIMRIDEIEYDLSIVISYAYGNDSLENARHGIKELLFSNTSFIIATDLSKNAHEQAKNNMKILSMVRNALNDDRIVSYFQPIINNNTKKIEKIESLVRLIKEDGKVLSPYSFLDIAKNGKYYSQITNKVLENSFNALSECDFNISVNLSALDIEKRSTRNKIIELLNQYKNDAHRIIFELLEDENIKDYDTFSSFISFVKSHGAKIAIDDFGTGYSNFERLLDYQPDILKIDASLVKNIVDNEFSLNIVKIIVEFARKLNIKTVAEFVENKEIFDVVTELGVDYSQGYYFCAPVALEEIN